MRQLFPTATDVDLRDAYAVTRSPYLRANMVSSLDGAATVGQEVSPLGGDADQEVLHLLRDLSDVVLVGAGTIRAEGYGPNLLPEAAQQRRSANGEPAVPRIAVLSGRLDLDFDAPVFTAAKVPPLVLTAGSPPADRRRAAERVAEVVVAGDAVVDPTAAVRALTDRGLSQVLSEGGPHLLAQLYAAGLVDELCLSLSPRVVLGPDLRVTSGPPLPQPVDHDLAHVLTDEGFLFLRYLRRADYSERRNRD